MVKSQKLKMYVSYFAVAGIAVFLLAAGALHILRELAFEPPHIKNQELGVLDLDTPGSSFKANITWPQNRIGSSLCLVFPGDESDGSDNQKPIETQIAVGITPEKSHEPLLTRELSSWTAANWFEPDRTAMCILEDWFRLIPGGEYALQFTVQEPMAGGPSVRVFLYWVE